MPLITNQTDIYKRKRLIIEEVLLQFSIIIVMMGSYCGMPAERVMLRFLK